MEAAKWAGALVSLGWTVAAVAGSGRADRLIPGLGYDAVGGQEGPASGPSELSERIADALSGFDLVVVENVLSLPLNHDASLAVARVLAHRPAIVKHHDLPWHRVDTKGWQLPDDGAWAHVTTTHMAGAELAGRGVNAIVMHNRFDLDGDPGDRDGFRSILGITGPVVLQPTRALPRKNVSAGLALAESVGASFWLMGPAEDGYQPALDELIGRARVRVIRGDHGRPAAEAYAASDGVVLPSSWEGFGNPTIESVAHRLPLAIGPYPAGVELRGYGFRWFDLDDIAAFAAALQRVDSELTEHNLAIARRHFDLRDLPGEIESVLASRGW